MCVLPHSSESVPLQSKQVSVVASPVLLQSHFSKKAKQITDLSAFEKYICAIRRKKEAKIFRKVGFIVVVFCIKICLEEL